MHLIAIYVPWVDLLIIWPPVVAKYVLLELFQHLIEQVVKFAQRESSLIPYLIPVLCVQPANTMKSQGKANAHLVYQALFQT